MASIIAVDLGATSGRVVLANLDEAKLSLTEVHRFSTSAQPTDLGLQLDVIALLGEIQVGIGKAITAAPGPVSALGIDSWAVDYGLLGPDGLVGLPFNYRDERTLRGRERVRSIISHAEHYARVGIQDTPFNTVNQLADDLAAGRLDSAERFLLLPDLIGFLLTGLAVAERTNASTTALLDPRTLDWDWALIDRLGLPRRIFAPVVAPGTIVGPIVNGPAAGVPLVAVGSHDTASAVVGAPIGHDDDVYISSGTWSLIGMELDRPILTEESRVADLTNEVGVDNTFRYLKNVMGMWILSEAMRTWTAQGQSVSLPQLLAEAAQVSGAPRFDATDETLLLPGEMPQRVAALVGGDPRMADPAFFTRCVLESLADSYAGTIEELARLTGRKPRRIAIVGGGSQNALLNQLTAERTGLIVSAGPVEATAIGNALTQARAVRLIPDNLASLRSIVVNSASPITYIPAGDPLTTITALSNEFGADPGFTRAGGGNSSAKLDGVLHIKPSGVSLATMQAADLVPLDLEVLKTALDAPDPDPSLGDPVAWIAQQARLDEGPRRPSVEILFHALIPDTYVLHTHPLLINAVTCNTAGEALTRELFGDDVVWVDYVDPGLPLAREIKRRREEHEQRTGRTAPGAVFLMNHGLIVSGNDPQAVRSTSYAIVEKIASALAKTPHSPAVRADGDLLAAAEAFRVATGSVAVATDTGDLASGFTGSAEGRDYLAAGPLIPDQIVYAGSFALVLEAGADLTAELIGFKTLHNCAPVVAVLPGVGVAAVGDSMQSASTAVSVFVDALTVARDASCLGAVRALNEPERRFIETWEAEAYRKQVARS